MTRILTISIMLMKLLITALAIGAAIGETDSSNLRGRELADTKKSVSILEGSLAPRHSTFPVVS